VAQAVAPARRREGRSPGLCGLAILFFRLKPLNFNRKERKEHRYNSFRLHCFVLYAFFAVKLPSRLFVTFVVKRSLA
jgi:hypothetical protein